MNKGFIICLLSLSALLVSACTDKEKADTIRLTGEYSGTFTVEYNSGDTFSNAVTVVFDGNRYTCSSGTNRIPAGGSGTYYIDGAKIVFMDENMWTADFDWNLILSGEYDLSATETGVEISSMKNELGFYQYTLNSSNTP